MKKKLIYLLIFLSLGVGIFATRKPIETKKEVKPINYTLNEKIDYSKAITDKLESIDKREIMQINLTHRFTLKSKFQNDFFRNNKNVVVTAIGVYKFNSSYEIILNKDCYVINLKLETDIIESKLSIEDDKGYFIFADYTITLEEAEEIRQRVHEELIKEMNNEANLTIVKDRAERLIKGNENYTVEVRWDK